MGATGLIDFRAQTINLALQVRCRCPRLQLGTPACACWMELLPLTGVSRTTLQGDFNLDADLSVAGSLKFSSDPDPFTIDQETPTQLALRATTVDAGTGLPNSNLLLDVASVVVSGDLTLSATDPADPAELRLQNADSVVTLGRHTGDTVVMRHQSRTSPFAAVDLLTMDGAANTFSVQGTLVVDNAGLSTALKNRLR